MDLPVGQVELYQMDIYRNKEFTKPVVLGNSINGNKAEVVFDETLYVRTYIDGGNVSLFYISSPISYQYFFITQFLISGSSWRNAGYQIHRTAITLLD